MTERTLTPVPLLPDDRPETRGRKPSAVPPEQLEHACRLLETGKIPGKLLWKIAGFTGEKACRKALSEHLLGSPDHPWVHLYTSSAVRKMQESPESARTIPTVLCGDCPFFTPDDRLTRVNNCYLRFGTCSETGDRTERCSHCVYGIYEDSCYPDQDYIVHEGRHLKHGKRST